MPLIEYKLTIKQQNFADFYIELGNATQAYLKASPNVKKESTAKAAASRMLTNVNLKAYIEERLEELKSERVADQQEVLETLTAILRGEQRGTALVGLSMGEQSVDQVEPTVAEKIRAAELLGKLIKIEHQLVRLVNTRVGYDHRYWFECPLCYGRTKKLYITASHYVWKCRKCHNLTYIKSDLSGNDFRYVDYQIQVLQKELQVTKENSYPLLGFNVMIERVPIFKPRYMPQTKFDDKKLILELMICRRVELWMRSIRF